MPVDRVDAKPKAFESECAKERTTSLVVENDHCGFFATVNAHPHPCDGVLDALTIRRDKRPLLLRADGETLECVSGDRRVRCSGIYQGIDVFKSPAVEVTHLHRIVEGTHAYRSPRGPMVFMYAL